MSDDDFAAAIECMDQQVAAAARIPPPVVGRRRRPRSDLELLLELGVIGPPRISYEAPHRTWWERLFL